MARSRPSRLHGFLIVDKPAGWTSHDVVGRIRRLCGERRVGHAGTLDPAATGVLPIAVGDATKTLEFLGESSKTYLAEITFGVSTDSYDADGLVTRVVDSSFLTLDMVERALATFRGPGQQLPPMHSAVQIGGKRLYELARQGVEIEREPRPVVFHDISIVAWDCPVVTVCVDCSKGTYIRTLAHDIGRQLGCGAHLSDLVRSRSGPFWLEQAWTLQDLAAIDLVNEWERTALHPDTAIAECDGIVFGPDEVRDWRHGKPLHFPSTDAYVRVYDDEGAWLGVARGDGVGAWKPERVIEAVA